MTAWRQIPTFVINLEKDIERREDIYRQCAEQGITPTFIKAVDGCNISLEVMERFYVDKWAISRLGRSLVRNEVACVLSHRKVYQEICAKGFPFGLVLEDDAILSDELKRFINNFEGSFPKHWDVILLGTSGKPVFDIKRSYVIEIQIAGYKLFRPVEICYGTYGYLISFSGAKKLLRKTEKIFLPADWYTGNPDWVRNFVVAPNLVFHPDRNETMQSKIGVRPRPFTLEFRLTPNSKLKQVIKKAPLFHRINTIRMWFLNKLKNFQVFLKQLNPFY